MLFLSDFQGDEPVGHYDVLGIARAASNVEIRVAYRKGALQTHPDTRHL